MESTSYLGKITDKMSAIAVDLTEYVEQKGLHVKVERFVIQKKLPRVIVTDATGHFEQRESKRGNLGQEAQILTVELVVRTIELIHRQFPLNFSEDGLHCNTRDECARLNLSVNFAAWRLTLRAFVVLQCARKLGVLETPFTYVEL